HYPVLQSLLRRRRAHHTNTRRGISGIEHPRPAPLSTEVHFACSICMLAKGFPEGIAVACHHRPVPPKPHLETVAIGRFPAVHALRDSSTPDPAPSPLTSSVVNEVRVCLPSHVYRDGLYSYQTPP